MGLGIHICACAFCGSQKQRQTMKRKTGGVCSDLSMGTNDLGLALLFMLVFWMGSYLKHIS